MRESVIPKLQAKNEGDGNTTRYFWVRDGAPSAVYKALQLLMYSGIVSIDKDSVVGRSDWVGTRYGLNLGVLFAESSYPLSEMLRIGTSLSVANPVLFADSHNAFDELRGYDFADEGRNNDVLMNTLSQDIDNLDLTDFQKMRIREQDLTTIKEVLEAPEDVLKRGYYIGKVRAREMHNAAQAAVMEYLLG